MRQSELERAVRDEFGGLGAVLLNDLVLSDLGGRTGNDALAHGYSPRQVWLALCVAQQVPKERWHGVGLRKPIGAD